MKELPLVVVRGYRTSLLHVGRNWLRHIQLDWKCGINAVNQEARESQVNILCKKKYKDVFTEE